MPSIACACAAAARYVHAIRPLTPLRSVMREPLELAAVQPPCRPVWAASTTVTTGPQPPSLAFSPGPGPPAQPPAGIARSRGDAHRYCNTYCIK